MYFLEVQYKIHLLLSLSGLSNEKQQLFKRVPRSVIKRGGKEGSINRRPVKHLQFKAEDWHPPCIFSLINICLCDFRLIVYLITCQTFHSDFTNVCGRLILKCLCWTETTLLLRKRLLHSSQHNYRARHFPTA